MFCKHLCIICVFSCPGSNRSRILSHKLPSTVVKLKTDNDLSKGERGRWCLLLGHGRDSSAIVLIRQLVRFCSVKFLGCLPRSKKQVFHKQDFHISSDDIRRYRFVLFFFFFVIVKARRENFSLMSVNSTRDWQNVRVKIGSANGDLHPSIGALH